MPPTKMTSEETLPLPKKKDKIGQARATAEVRRAKVLAERRTKLQLCKYTATAGSIRGKIAELLIWAADNYPGEILTYEEITQVIYGLSKVPFSNSQQVLNTRGRMADVRDLLRKKYNRDLLNALGVGARASTDSADVLLISMPKAAATYERAAAKLEETASLINNAEVTQIIEQLTDPVLREELVITQQWYTEKMLKAIKQLRQKGGVKALMPPETKKKEEE